MARQEINGRPIIWRPQPRQAAFMRRSEDEALYGGAAGGGALRRGGCRAGRRRSEGALGRRGLLGAASLASLQFGSRAGREGALRLAASLA